MSEKTQATPGGFQIFKWTQGLGVSAPDQPDMKVYVWFYEWNMFDAVFNGQHTNGTYENQIEVAADHKSGTVTSEPLGLKLDMQAVADGVDMTLHVTNQSDHPWPKLAAIIPCFNPGPEENRNPEFANTKTYFLGQSGLGHQEAREIHYNHALRDEIDQAADAEGKYDWSFKWPKSDQDASGGLILRESTNGEWVTGIAWERFLSAQGHNPWECMHLSVRVGPLQQGESRTIKGKIYLLRGTKDELLQRYRHDFG